MFIGISANNIIGIGWNSNDAPELLEYIKSLKVGDIVYIKAAFGGKSDITIKAIGIIKDNILVKDTEYAEFGRNVKWLNTDRFNIARPSEKNNVRSNTIYEEFHPDVLKEIIDKI